MAARVIGAAVPAHQLVSILKLGIPAKAGIHFAPGTRIAACPGMTNASQSTFVIPAKAGILFAIVSMDSRVRGNDERISKHGFRIAPSSITRPRPDGATIYP
jgi:hypothetical protein